MVKVDITSGLCITVDNPLDIGAWRLQVQGDNFVFLHCMYGTYVPSGYCITALESGVGDGSGWCFEINDNELSLFFNGEELKCWSVPGDVVRWNFDGCCNTVLKLEAERENGEVVELECFEVACVATIITELCNCLSYENKPPSAYLESLCCLQKHFQLVQALLDDDCQNSCGGSSSARINRLKVLADLKCLDEVLSQLKVVLTQDLSQSASSPSEGVRSTARCLCQLLIDSSTFVVFNADLEPITTLDDLVCLSHIGVRLYNPNLCKSLPFHLKSGWVDPRPDPDAGSYCPVCQFDPPFQLTGIPSGGVFTGLGVEVRNVAGVGVQYIFNPGSDDLTPGTKVTITYTITDSAGLVQQDTTDICLLDLSNTNCRRHPPTAQIALPPPICQSGARLKLEVIPSIPLDDGAFGPLVTDGGFITLDGTDGCYYFEPSLVPGPGMYSIQFTYTEPDGAPQGQAGMTRTLRSMVCVRDC